MTSTKVTSFLKFLRDNFPEDFLTAEDTESHDGQEPGSTEGCWTDQPPDKPGYYWMAWRGAWNPALRWHIQLITPQELVVMACATGYMYDRLWYSQEILQPYPPETGGK